MSTLEVSICGKRVHFDPALDWEEADKRTDRAFALRRKRSVSPRSIEVERVHRKVPSRRNVFCPIVYEYTILALLLTLVLYAVARQLASKQRKKEAKRIAECECYY